MHMIADTMRNFINLKQKDGENLINYTARSKSTMDVLVAQIGGPIILMKSVTSISGYNVRDADKTKKQQKQAFDKFTALVYLENLDQTKYCTLITLLSSQLSLGNDQYPADIAAATSVLTNHRFDSAYSETRKKRWEQEKSGPQLTKQ